MPHDLLNNSTAIKELPIYFPPPVKMFLHHSVPLSMILTKNVNFLYSNYIQIFNSKLLDYVFDFYPNINFTDLRAVFDFKELSSSIFDINQNEIVDKIINWIDKNYYVSIFLDEYYINGVRPRKKPTLHQIFIWGYNLYNKTFKIINFNDKAVFSIIEVTFDDIIKSFNAETTKMLTHNIFGLENYCIRLYRLNSDVIEQSYTMPDVYRQITEGIDDYLCSRNSNNKNRIKYSLYNDENTIWGIKVYDLLREYLLGSYKSKFGYQCVIGFVEHKTVMYERLKFIKSNNFIHSTDIIDTYYMLLTKAQSFKNLYLKYIMTQNGDLLNRIICVFDEIKECEVQILNKTLNELKKGG